MAESVDPAQCDQAAAALGLTVTGRAAARQIADYVREHGPERGHRVVEALFSDAPAQGPQQIHFATLFKYACQRHDVLRFKLNPAQANSPLVVAFREPLGCE